MFELQHLRAFIAVAEELHFGRAASRLNLSQPPLSQQIRRLERELGVQLFERNRRAVRLTAAGSAFLIEARRIHADAERAAEMVRRVARGESGTLRVGFASSSVLWALPEAVRKYRHQYPDVHIQLQEATTAEQLELLRVARLDLGIVRGPLRGETPSLRLEVVFREPLVAALPSNHRLATHAKVELADLASEPLVLFPREVAPGFHEAILASCLEAGYSPMIVQEAAEYQTLVSLVAAQVGITLVPSSVRALRLDGVVYVPIRGASPIVELVAACRPDAGVAAANFLQELRSADVRRTAGG
jgi:DNA-binding transcriptional LysR family regulator